MRKIGCRDLGVDCDYVAKGDTDERLKKDLWAHAEKKHADVVRGMTPEKKKAMQAKMDEVLKRPMVART